jgi:hypothetical protein
VREFAALGLGLRHVPGPDPALDRAVAAALMRALEADPSDDARAAAAAAVRVGKLAGEMVVVVVGGGGFDGPCAGYPGSGVGEAGEAGWGRPWRNLFACTGGRVGGG